MSRWVEIRDGMIEVEVELEGDSIDILFVRAYAPSIDEFLPVLGSVLGGLLTARFFDEVSIAVIKDMQDDQDRYLENKGKE